MAISYNDFHREMNHAQAMIAESSEEMKEYWRAYQRGLSRKYHGDKYQSLAIHKLRYAMAESDNPAVARKGEGYRAGYHYDERRGGNRVGRKSVGNSKLPEMRVPDQIALDLKKLSELSGEATADIRRRILENGLMNELKRWRKE